MVDARLWNRWRMGSRWVAYLLGVGLLIVVMIVMTRGWHERTEPGDAAEARRQVGDRQVRQVETIRTVESVAAVGTVRSKRTTEVSSQLLAVIVEITVRPGDMVSAGQTLVRLDDREIQVQLREAQAGLAALEADLAVRGRDYSRYQSMVAQGAVTKEEFDRVEGLYEVARAQLDRAREQVNRVDVLLSYTTITASESGVVSQRLVEPGDLAAPGKPLLVVQDPTELELHASVPEGLASHVRVGLELQVEVEAVGLVVEGTVREIVPQAEAASRSVLVKVTLPASTNGSLYTGMFGRLQIPVGEVERRVLDRRAVLQIGQLDMVDVVSGDGSLERRAIRTGRNYDGKLEILSGLDRDEQVAVPPSDPTVL